MKTKPNRRLPWEFAAIRRGVPRNERGADSSRHVFSSLLSWTAVKKFPVWLLLAAVLSPAQPLHPTEFQVKAAYLYNFGKFVRWQGGHGAISASRDICVFGKDPFGAVLDATVAGETLDGSPITVKRPTKIRDTAQCGGKPTGRHSARGPGGGNPNGERYSKFCVARRHH